MRPAGRAGRRFHRSGPDSALSGTGIRAAKMQAQTGLTACPDFCNHLKPVIDVILGPGSLKPGSFGQEARRAMTAMGRSLYSSGLVDIFLNRDIRGELQHIFVHEGPRRTPFFDPRRDAQKIFPVRGRVGRSLFPSREVAEGLPLSTLKRPAPIVNKTWSDWRGKEDA